MSVSEVPPGAVNINVDGLPPVSALQGFGQLWQKTYRVRLEGLQKTTVEVMEVWKANFPKYHPPDSRFYPPMTGIQPGEVLFIEGLLPPMYGAPSFLPMNSGVRVIYVDDESFTIMTPVGFPEAGWNTFSVFDDEGTVTAQVQSLARAADPMYEFFFRFLGSGRWQERVWITVLTNLAADFGIKAEPAVKKVLVDPRLQWSEAKNIVKNAGIRTVFYRLGAPVRWIVRRKK
jgi:hypothetical protein